MQALLGHALLALYGAAPKLLMPVLRSGPVVRWVTVPLVLPALIVRRAKAEGVKVRWGRAVRWVRRKTVLDFFTTAILPIAADDALELADMLRVRVGHPRYSEMVIALEQETYPLQSAGRAVGRGFAKVEGTIRRTAETQGEQLRTLLSGNATPALGPPVDVVDRARTATRSSRAFSTFVPTALGVHPAVTVGVHDGGQEEAAIPAYVERPHDAEIRRAILGGAGDEAPRDPVFVAVWGPSCSGKSRSAWEAVAASPLRDWAVLRPVSLEQLVGHLESGVAAETVLWLDDLEDFFGAEFVGADHALGRRAVGYLADLLTAGDLGGLVVLATMWSVPTISAAPGGAPLGGAGTLEGAADRSGVARLFQLATTVRVAEDFDRRALADVARSDEQLRFVLEQIPPGSAPDADRVAASQFFAGGAHHLHAYRTAEPSVRAVLTAAMGLRRVGLPNPIPHVVLVDAAARLLTEETTASGARASAMAGLTGAAEPWRGTHALREVDRGGEPAYELHDYLHYSHLRQSRSAPTIAAVWSALVDQRGALSTSDVRAVSNDAVARGLRREAALLTTPASARSGKRWDGSTDLSLLAMRSSRALDELTRMLGEPTGPVWSSKPGGVADFDRTELYEAWAARGDFDALERAAKWSWVADKELSDFAFDTTDVQALVERAAADSYSAESLHAELLLLRGDLDGLRRLHDEGNHQALGALVEQYIVTNRLQDVIDLAVHEWSIRRKLAPVLRARVPDGVLTQAITSPVTSGHRTGLLRSIVARRLLNEIDPFHPSDDHSEFGMLSLVRGLDDGDLALLADRGLAAAMHEQIDRATTVGDVGAIADIARRARRSFPIFLGFTHMDPLEHAVEALLLHGAWRSVVDLPEQRGVDDRLISHLLATDNVEGLRALALARGNDAVDDVLEHRTLAWALGAVGEWDFVLEHFPSSPAAVARYVALRDVAALRGLASGMGWNPTAQAALQALGVSPEHAVRAMRGPADGAKAVYGAVTALAHQGRFGRIRRLARERSDVLAVAAGYFVAAGRTDELRSLLVRGAHGGRAVPEWVVPFVLGHQARPSLRSALVKRIIAVGDAAALQSLRFVLRDQQDLELMRELGSDDDGVLVEASPDREEEEDEERRTWAQWYKALVEDLAVSEIGVVQLLSGDWAAELSARRLERRGDWDGVTTLALAGDRFSLDALINRLLLRGDAERLIELCHGAEQLPTLHRWLLKRAVVEALTTSRAEPSTIKATIGDDHAMRSAYESYLIDAGRLDEVMDDADRGTPPADSRAVVRAAFLRGDLAFVERRAASGDDGALDLLTKRAIALGDDAELVRLCHFPFPAAAKALLARATAARPQEAPFTLRPDGAAVPWRD
ncbi:hypothetical protein Q7F20_08155 [Curtobacterium sp. A7_M15]|uniref:hypothetical protein n=1 Tax=Curtobacterium sp. A7_M15 TaxID=3065241 RepID=UPI002737C8F4|nr:hypothetical protein [Curtobacterium sp. A7_M15]MDP4333341.1 hypothetical protein [Curtobacterium sp. A7_M15]